MSITGPLAGAVALAMLSCSGDYTDVDTEQGDTDAVETPSQDLMSHRRRRWGTSAGGSGGTVVTRETSDGERIQVFVPEPAPAAEVPAGGQCGVVVNGVLLSCAPGTYCVSPGDGRPGTCVAAPRAPISEG